MASNPMLQAVLRFQNQQTTTPYKPIELEPEAPAPAGVPGSTGPEPAQPFDASYQPGASEAHAMARPKEEKKEPPLPFDPLEEDDADDSDVAPSENDESEEEKDNG